MLSEWWSRIRFFIAGKKRADVDEELRFHMEREIEANIAAGMPAAEAKRRAMIAFGSRERAREECRAERPSYFLESLGRDLRFGLRGLWRNPGFTSMAVLTLGLAIGANATIFSLFDQALMQALPVRSPNELVVLNYTGSRSGHLHSEGGNSPGHQHEFSYPMYKDLRDGNRVLSGLIAECADTLGVTWNNHAESVQAELVSGNYFETLGVPPAVGRVFGGGDETAPGANPVAVLNFDYWKSHLAEAPVVGKTMLVNGTPFTIAGVAAPGFHSMVWGHTPADLRAALDGAGAFARVDSIWPIASPTGSRWRAAEARHHACPGGGFDQSAFSGVARRRVQGPTRSICESAAGLCWGGVPAFGGGCERV